MGLSQPLRYLAYTAAAWYFYKHFIKPFLSPLRKIPGCPYRPIVGNLLETMREGANNNGIRWMQKYKSRIIRFYFLGGEGAVLVGDPDVVKHILVTNSKHYKRHSSSFLEMIVPGFLALISGEEHHALRRLVNPVFNSLAVEGFVPSFEKLGRKLVKSWTDKARDQSCVLINAQSDMTRLTLDAICSCGFDYEMNSLEEGSQSPQVKAFQMILAGLQLSYLQMLNMAWFPTEKTRRIKAAMDLYRSTIIQVIAAKQGRMEEGDMSKDILSQLLCAKDDNGKRLSEDSLYSQVGGFLFAGYETTSMTLTWTLLELARNKEVQEKARSEVMAAIPDKHQSIDMKTLDSKLGYLTCVIKESLRHHTPFSTIFRRALKDDHIQGYLIPAGTLVGINFGALHRLPDLWEDPQSFKPERFDESCPQNSNSRSRYSFLPFGAGPYMCIGNLFSMAETKMTLALILRHFTLSLPQDYSYKTVRKLTIQPSPQLQLLITPL